jgi:hypothetical protein
LASFAHFAHFGVPRGTNLLISRNSVFHAEQSCSTRAYTERSRSIRAEIRTSVHISLESRCRSVGSGCNLFHDAIPARPTVSSELLPETPSAPKQRAKIRRKRSALTITKPKKLPNPQPRPRSMNEGQLHALLFAGCTQPEIAGYFGLTPAVVEHLIREGPHRELYAKGVADRNLSLRRAQMKLAMKGNVGMLIWLGKQLLGQREYARIEHTGADGGAVRTTFQVEYVDPGQEAKALTVESEASAAGECAEDSVAEVCLRLAGAASV